MSVKHTYTTSDYLEWNSMLSLVRKLYKNGEYRMSLLVGCGCFFGLRISDLRTLKWNMLLGQESFMLQEKKTGKRRIIRINQGFQNHIQDCFDALQISDRNENCFLSRKKCIYTTQRINVLLKEIKDRYNVKIGNFSTHTFRKTFGRKIVDNAGTDAEMALIKLSEIFNHSSPMITRRYLGLRQQELEQVYDSLDF
ncbi:MAG: tyrosine-type recombinase/integrase [Bacteroidales bacterium]|nr:tyrosine-type recombinase/integrase [Bacteroidales bacterium]